MDLDTVSGTATNIANCIMGNAKIKEKARDTFMVTVALACLAYTQDETFKRDIDNYLQYVRSPQYKLL